MSEAERLDAFIARANAAYYAGRNPFADFTTAPEIAQAFGEVLGAWAAACWAAMGRPARVLLAEAGPGRGTLMADALRTVARVAPDFRAAIALHLVETSPRLATLAAEKLPVAGLHPRLADLPPGPLLLIGNEFLDALPIRQFVRRPTGWTERWVSDGAFVERDAVLPEGFAPPPGEPGEVVEFGAGALDVAAGLGARLAASGGAALFLDYGPAASAPGDSLQALRDGRAADPLDAPGAADLTAHVDFAAVARAGQAAGAVAWGPLTQGAFLARLGLHQRTARLARDAPPAVADGLRAAARRLTAPDQMGHLFKALALCHPGLLPPGFAPAERAPKPGDHR